MLHPIPVPKRPFERVHADHLGPFMKSKKKNMFVLVIVDALTKFVKLYCVKNTSVKPVIRSFEQFTNNFGVPRMVVTDRGTCFTSREFEGYCKKMGIHHTLNSSRHPQANKQVERVNRTLVPLISAYGEKEDEWDKNIKLVERCLNSAESKTTRKTPF